MLPLAAVSPLWGIAAALIPAALALIGQALVRLKENRDRRRGEYGRAFAAALGWAELPYRVARRLSNEAEACRPLIEAFHQAQQEILYHRGWLQSISSDIGQTYDELVEGVKSQTAPHLAAAWKGEPVPVDAMSIGPIYEVDIAAEQAAFITAVRRDLSLTERLFDSSARRLGRAR